jgi:hypothetical protein
VIVSNSVQAGDDAFRVIHRYIILFKGFHNKKKTLISILLVYHFTHVNPRQFIASANISPSSDGNEFKAGKYACI